MIRAILLAVVLLAGHSNAFATSVVDSASFTPGRSWTWIYSSFDKASAVWSPYFQETYTVEARSGSKVTVIMQSSELGKPISEPHHKFTADLAHCERQARDPKFRSWTVTFYSRNLAAGKWTLVSSAHPNLVFSEKFNCAPPADGVETGLADNGDPIFQYPPRKGQDSTWYFDLGTRHSGVSARKLFAPAYVYKAEFSHSN